MTLNAGHSADIAPAALACGYTSPGRLVNTYPLGPCQFCRRSTIHFWSASPLTRYTLPSVTTSNTVARVTLGSPHGAFLLGLCDVKVGRIVGAGGLHIQAVPPPVRVRDRHSTPLRHGNRVTGQEKKRRI